MSLTPMIAQLETLAGTAGKLSYLEVPQLIVSNITSVVFALMDANQDGMVDPGEEAAFDSFLTDNAIEVKQAIRGIATAVKVVIDDPSVDLQTVVELVRANIPGMEDLPTDTDDILELVSWVFGRIQPFDFLQVLSLANEMLTLFQQAFPGPIQTAQQAMREDPILMEQFGMWANTLPVALGGQTTTPEDQPTTANVLALDIDGDPLTPVLVSDPIHGTVAVNADGSFTYTPNPDFHGPDSFAYFVSDGIGRSNEAVFEILVTPVNDAPVLDQIGDQSTEEGGTLTFTAQASDPDLPIEVLVFSLGEDAPEGAVIDPTSGLFTWTLAGVQGPGTYAITVRVTDDDTLPLFDEETFWVFVNNTAPTAGDDTAETDEGTPIQVDVLANDSDVGGDTLNIAGLNVEGTIGLVSLENGVLTYDPNAQFESLAAGQTATDSFIYTIEDDDGGTDTATVVITITGTNDAPVAADDAYEVDENSTLTVLPAEGLLVNDSDIDQDLLTVSLVSGPANGSLTLADDGSFSYTPNPGFIGNDTFTYTAEDGGATSDLATVTVTVHRAIELTGVVTDGPIAGAVVSVLLNGEAVSGLATTDPNGEFSLKIRPDQLPADARPLIRATEVSGGIRLMSLLPTVAELDLLSGAADQLSYLQASELKVSNITSAVFTVMDSNEDGTVDEAEKAYFDTLLADSPTVTKQAIRSMAAAIKVVVDDPYVSMGTVILMAAPVAELPDDFDVMDMVGNDAVLAMFTDVFSEEIQDAVEAMRHDPMLMDQFEMWANNQPVASDVAATTLEDHPVTVACGAVDPDDDPLVVTLVGGPSNGTLAIDDTGAFTYTPNQDFNGVDSFTYCANDGGSDSNIATATITVDDFGHNISPFPYG